MRQHFYMSDKPVHKAMFELSRRMKEDDWKALWKSGGDLQGLGEAIAMAAKREKKPLRTVAQRYYDFYFKKSKLKKVM